MTEHFKPKTDELRRLKKCGIAYPARQKIDKEYN